MEFCWIAMTDAMVILRCRLYSYLGPYAKPLIHDHYTMSPRCAS
jgi:hypothetical protein